ncbi:cytochrome P450 [Chiua virens]|nr:cytochrome P450 [Chiua virens]
MDDMEPRLLQFPFLPLVLCIIFLHELCAKYRARHLPPDISGLQCLVKIPNLTDEICDIASWSIGGYNIIIIGTAKIAEDLLEKRSINYSDRPRSVMCGEMSGWGKITLLSNYNDWFRTHRKWIAQEIGSYTTVARLHRMIEFKTRRYLQCVLEDPDNIQAHIRKNLTLIMISHTNPNFVAMRCTRADDWYDKYLIPAGSYVFVNIWAILHDERTYTEPMEFKPERFLEDNPKPHPENACSGFGRRKCPGYFLGHSSAWLMCTRTLAVFDISKRIESGMEITPEFNLVGETIVFVV